jgi:hypothetical protein
MRPLLTRFPDKILCEFHVSPTQTTYPTSTNLLCFIKFFLNFTLIVFILVSYSWQQYWYGRLIQTWTIYFNLTATQSRLLQQLTQRCRTFLQKLIVASLLKYISQLLLTHSMEKSPSWAANSHSAIPDIPVFYRTWRFSTMFTSSRHWAGG